MKFRCIFAVFTPRTKTYSVCENGLFSYPLRSDNSANIGYRLSLDAHSPNACRFLAEREAVAFFILHTLKFCSGMPRTSKICAGAKHSNAARVSNPDTVQSTATIRMRCSNPYSIPVFEDFMAECQRRFDTEREAKNKAYHFIMSKGLDEDFREFCKEHDSRDSYKDCVNHLLSTMTIK